MGFLKRYPVFCALIVLLLLVLGAGIYLAMGQQAKAREEKQAFETKLRQVEQVSRGVLYDEETGLRIAPTAANRARLEERLEQVRVDLRTIRDAMVARTESILTGEADEFTFLPKLQAFIAQMKSEAAAEGVRLNQDEAFGFARYAIRAEQPAEESIPILDRQRQVLEYILAQLLESGPSAILSVERELVEVVPAPAQTQRERRGNAREDDEDVFTIEELVTARSNEFINTFAFRLVFTGRTDVLRRFLNRLALFELPLVVRSIEVAPVEEDDEPEAARDDDGGGEDALFALFGGSPEPAADNGAADDGREPVITENKSKFTVVIEFVEVLIQEQDEAEEEA